MRLNPCCLCPHKCGVNRLAGEKGKCRSTKDLYVSSYNLHFGEEPSISGFSGSGAIFFTNCSLACVFCQNYPISQLGNGNKSSIDELAEIMLKLQSQGAHNINFVTPTHFVPQIVDAVDKARNKGLKVPLVYNCGGYEEIETLRLLDGIIDIYMPDAKYSDNEMAEKYSGAPDYREVNKRALKEMHRQVGDLVIDEKGIAIRGLLVRHLILPENISGSKQVLEFIANELSKNTYVSLMAQFHPAHKAEKFPKISRRISDCEYQEVLDIFEKLGLEKGWKQEL